MGSAQDNNKPFKVFKGALRKFLFIFSSLLITAKVVLDIILPPIDLDALSLFIFIFVYISSYYTYGKKYDLLKRELAMWWLRF